MGAMSRRVRWGRAQDDSARRGGGAMSRGWGWGRAQDASARGVGIEPVACALLALVAGPAVGRAETGPAYGGAVEASLLSEPIALDPVAAQSHAELTVVAL